MKIAYADPPYPGTAMRYYQRREVNHERLVAALDRFDGWALSTSQAGLRMILPMCPPRARIGIWCRDEAQKGGRWPRACWEPVIFAPARIFSTGSGRRNPPRDRPWVKDWVFSNRIRNGFIGAKPPEFCGWLFEILCMEPEDDFHDLFHGSGAVKRAWRQWRAVEGGGGPLFAATDDHPEDFRSGLEMGCD